MDMAVSTTSRSAFSSAHPELADLFRLFGKAYFQMYPAGPAQYRVMKDILLCRTAALGGHLYRCNQTSLL